MTESGIAKKHDFTPSEEEAIGRAVGYLVLGLAAATVSHHLINAGINQKSALKKALDVSAGIFCGGLAATSAASCIFEIDAEFRNIQ